MKGRGGVASSAWHINQIGPPYRSDLWAWAQSSVRWWSFRSKGGGGGSSIDARTLLCRHVCVHVCACVRAHGRVRVRVQCVRWQAHGRGVQTCRRARGLAMLGPAGPIHGGSVRGAEHKKKNVLCRKSAKKPATTNGRSQL